MVLRADEILLESLRFSYLIMIKLILKEILISALQSIIWVAVIILCWMVISTFHTPRNLKASGNYYAFMYIKFLWKNFSIFTLIINLIGIFFNSFRIQILLNLALLSVAILFIGQGFEMSPYRVRLYIFVCFVTLLSRIPLEIFFHRLFNKKSIF